jgi:hypothetical protein
VEALFGEASGADRPGHGEKVGVDR